MQHRRCFHVINSMRTALNRHLNTSHDLQSSACSLASIRPGKSAQWMTAHQSVQCINSDDHVFVQMGANTPVEILRALSHHCRQNKLNNVHVHQLLTTGNSLLPEAEKEGVLRGNSLFTSPCNRAHITCGLHDYTPINLSDIGRAILNGHIKPKVSILQLSPPDSHGYLSYGPTVIAAPEALSKSDIRIGLVNSHCPRTFGDLIHESQMDILVRHDEPLPQLITKPPNEKETKIGKLIAEHLISNDSTIQIGIGSIPESVLKFLTNYQHLGLHSEMISDGVVQLIQNGNIDNSKKKIHAGKSVLTFAYGSQQLYDYLADNPSFIFKPSSFTNDISIIRQNPKPVAINSCLEIDLSGQAAADMIGANVYSGFGGQLDFLRGSALSDDGQGKAILAFVSQTDKGKSKIVPYLQDGARVVSTRTHVDYVVTEYGIAELFAKTLKQRAYELIQVAHPDHRAWLEEQAFKQLGCIPCKN